MLGFQLVDSPDPEHVVLARDLGRVHVQAPVLGTGLGSALIVDGVVEPLELGHLPFRKRTFEDYVSTKALEKRGKKKWQRAVFEVVERLTAALEPDYVVLGGGGVDDLDDLPP